MASSYSSDLKLELVSTGEKAGLWGTITNTNLQILQQSSSGVLSVDMAGADITLALTDGAESNGKNIFLKLTGTLSANRTLTMPSGSGVTRLWFVEDATVRGTSNRTLDVLTTSGTAQPVPPGSTLMCVSDGAQTTTTLIEKGYVTITDSNSSYTTVAGNQILANTASNPITIVLPVAPATGDEITIIDARGTFGSNNCIIDRNNKPINSGTSNLTLSTNGQALTLVYVDSTRGWTYKTNTA